MTLSQFILAKAQEGFSKAEIKAMYREACDLEITSGTFSSYERSVREVFATLENKRIFNNPQNI